MFALCVKTLLCVHEVRLLCLEAYYGSELIYEAQRDLFCSKRFTSKNKLSQMIESDIRYHNTRREQRNLGVLAPVEKHEMHLAA